MQKSTSVSSKLASTVSRLYHSTRYSLAGITYVHKRCRQKIAIYCLHDYLAGCSINSIRARVFHATFSVGLPTTFTARPDNRQSDYSEHIFFEVCLSDITIIFCFFFSFHILRRPCTSFYLLVLILYTISSVEWEYPIFLFCFQLVTSWIEPYSEIGSSWQSPRNQPCYSACAWGNLIPYRIVVSILSRKDLTQIFFEPEAHGGSTTLKGIFRQSNTPKSLHEMQIDLE